MPEKTEWYDNNSNGVILASGAAESANIVTYALMAFLKVDILVPARSDPGVPFPVHSRLRGARWESCMRKMARRVLHVTFSQLDPWSSQYRTEI